MSRKFNLAGSTPEEEAEVDAYASVIFFISFFILFINISKNKIFKCRFADQVGEIVVELDKEFREIDPERKQEQKKKNNQEVWPTNLKIFENRLAKNKGWLVGNGMTWADMHFVLALDWVEDEILAPYKHCKALIQKVTSTPKIAEWIKKRPVTAV